MVCSVCGSNKHNRKSCVYKISIAYYRNLVNNWSGNHHKHIRPDLRIVARCINCQIFTHKFSVHWSGVDSHLRDPFERMSSANIVRFIEMYERFIIWPDDIRSQAYVCGYVTKRSRKIQGENIRDLSAREQWLLLPHNTDDINEVRLFHLYNQ
jgi:hypothetical protein